MCKKNPCQSTNQTPETKFIYVCTSNQGHKDHKLSIRKAVVHCCCSGLNE